jgi:HPt (histidine-containing phosphotransfer) domain-containing protein
MDADNRQPRAEGAADGAGRCPSDAAPARVDWSVAMETTAGDVELLVEVLQAFQEETPQMVAEIHRALDIRDAALLHRAAHTVKNAMYSIGDAESGDIAFAIEKLGKTAAFEDVPPLLDQLDINMQQVEQEVNQYVRQHQGG